MKMMVPCCPTRRSTRNCRITSQNTNSRKYPLSEHRNSEYRSLLRWEAIRLLSHLLARPDDRLAPHCAQRKRHLDEHAMESLKRVLNIALRSFQKALSRKFRSPVLRHQGPIMLRDASVSRKKAKTFTFETRSSSKEHLFPCSLTILIDLVSLNTSRQTMQTCALWRRFRTMYINRSC